MSIRSSVRILTVLGLSLATTSVAFARNPPALVRAQGSQDRAVATSGYRESLARIGKPEARAEARQSPGYRDSLRRFASPKPLRVASHR
jgi:hypothetical protein